MSTGISNVIINGVALSVEQVEQIASYYRYRIPDGSYWYDPWSGAWGLQGGPTVGLTLPGLSLGGMLQPNASNGNTGVFINGRELHVQDVIGFQQMGIPVMQGRWWALADGNFGAEGNSFPMGNLRLMAQRGGQGGTLWSDGRGSSVMNLGNGECSASFRQYDGSSIGYEAGIGSTHYRNDE